MWYEYIIKRNYDEQKVKIVVEADNKEEAIENYQKWINTLENATAVDALFKEKVSYDYGTNGRWTSDEYETCPCNLNYDFEVKKTQTERRINIVIDYSEDPNIPIAIRSKRFYYARTLGEVYNIKKLWFNDFDMECVKIEWAKECPDKKYDTYYYKATSKVKEKRE